MIDSLAICETTNSRLKDNKVFQWGSFTHLVAWLSVILLSKIRLFLNLVKHTPKDSKYALIFPLSLVVYDLSAILWFFTKWKVQNISGTNAATWWQNLAADLAHLIFKMQDVTSVTRFSFDNETIYSHCFCCLKFKKMYILHQRTFFQFSSL